MGLIPAVVQDAGTREVLTVAYMNEEALRLTLEKARNLVLEPKPEEALAQR